MSNGHIWDEISDAAKRAMDAIKVPGFGNPPQGYGYDGKPYIPPALLPHWVLTEYDARSVLLCITEAQTAATAVEREAKLQAAAAAARRIVGRVIADNP